MYKKQQNKKLMLMGLHQVKMIYLLPQIMVRLTPYHIYTLNNTLECGLIFKVCIKYNLISQYSDFKDRPAGL